MKRDEFLKWFENYKDLMGIWTVDTDSIYDLEGSGNFVLGCTIDVETGKWKVYENGERGEHYIYLETDNEEEAFDKLKNKVTFIVEMGG